MKTENPNTNNHHENCTGNGSNTNRCAIHKRWCAKPPVVEQSSDIDIDRHSRSLVDLMLKGTKRERECVRREREMSWCWNGPVVYKHICNEPTA